MTEDFKKLKSHVEQIAQRENCFLYDLELSGKGQGRTLRVFIDKEGAEGVSIDDCSRVSRGLDLVLDVEDLVDGGAYQLEVSSPGLERRLNEPWHYSKVIGQTINIQLNAGLGEIVEGRSAKEEKRKKLVAKLKQAGETEIEVVMDGSDPEGETLKIPYQYIHRAKVVFVFENNFSNKKPKGKKG